MPLSFHGYTIILSLEKRKKKKVEILPQNLARSNEQEIFDRVSDWSRKNSNQLN